MSSRQKRTNILIVSFLSSITKGTQIISFFLVLSPCSSRHKQKKSRNLFSCSSFQSRVWNKSNIVFFFLIYLSWFDGVVKFGFQFGCEKRRRSCRIFEVLGFYWWSRVVEDGGARLQQWGGDDVLQKNGNPAGGSGLEFSMAAVGEGDRYQWCSRGVDIRWWLLVCWNENEMERKWKH